MIKKSPSPIKVMFISTGLNTGGAEMMLYRLISNMDRNKIKPIVFSILPEGSMGQKIREKNIKILSLNARNFAEAILAIPDLVRTIKREKPQILQGWMYHGNLMATIGSIGSKIPVMWSIHHWNLQRGVNKNSTIILAKLSAWLARWGKVTKIIFCSESSRQVHIQAGYPPKKSITIPNGFDMGIFKPDQEARKRVREKYAIPSSENLIGHVARFDPLKDHLTMLRSIDIFYRTGYDGSFLLCGKDISIKNPFFEKWVQKLNLVSHLKSDKKNYTEEKNKIYLLGHQEDIPSIMNGIDVLCLSSKGEAFPTVLGEAMACNVPCVTTNVGDAAWIVGNTGAIVPPSNPQGLSEAINNTLRLKKSTNNPINRIKTLSIETICNKYIEIYTKISFLKRRYYV